jgi:hypothetical protein
MRNTSSSLFEVFICWKIWLLTRFVLYLVLVCPVLSCLVLFRFVSFCFVLFRFIYLCITFIIAEWMALSDKYSEKSSDWYSTLASRVGWLAFRFYLFILVVPICWSLRHVVNWYLSHNITQVLLLYYNYYLYTNNLLIVVYYV